MDRRSFLSKAGRDALLAAGTCSLAGCGTVFHSERIGQPHSRDIDWKVAALNGLGLLFFFVPGVVAFAVDFYTGAIYLPYDCGYGPYPDYPPPGELPPPMQPPHNAQVEPIPTVPYSPNLGATTPSGFQKVRVPQERLDRRGIQVAVSKLTGQRVTLHDSSVRISHLPGLQEFAGAHEQHQADAAYGMSSTDFFAASRT